MTCISHGRQSNFSVNTSSPLTSCIGVAFQLLILPFACFGHRLKAKAQTMLGDHHRDFALLFMCPHTPRQSVAHHSDDKIHALSGCIRSRGNSDAFADKPAQDQQPVYGCRAGNWQDAQHQAYRRLHGGTGLTDCLVQTAPRQINLHIAGVIDGLPQFCQTILQIVHCFFGVIGFVELPVQRMCDADTLFTGEVRISCSCQPPSSMSTATRRSLEVLSVPAASYDQDFGLVGDAGEFCANLLAFHWARRGTDFLRFSLPY